MAGRESPSRRCRHRAWRAAACTAVASACLPSRSVERSTRPPRHNPAAHPSGNRCPATAPAGPTSACVRWTGARSWPSHPRPRPAHAPRPRRRPAGRHSRDRCSRTCAGRPDRDWRTGRYRSVSPAPPASPSPRAPADGDSGPPWHRQSRHPPPPHGPRLPAHARMPAWPAWQPRRPAPVGDRAGKPHPSASGHRHPEWTGRYRGNRAGGIRRGMP